MVVRGIHNAAEKKMLDDFNAAVDKARGWGKSDKQLCTEESMIARAMAFDYKNPLWRDHNYARGTRWGGIIAVPMYQSRIATYLLRLQPTPGCGFEDPLKSWIGVDWTFYRPIRVNDFIKIWRRTHYAVDSTDLDGKGPRRVRIIPHDVDLINQHDELVSTMKIYNEITFLTEPPEKPYYSLPEYSYTEKELSYIDELADSEEIRGSNIRNWEDVNVGNELKPVVLGPTTMYDVVSLPGVGGGTTPLSVRDVYKKNPGQVIVDPITGVTHLWSSKHMSDRIAQLMGYPGIVLDMGLGQPLMARLITNWIGDDGFLRRFNWRQLYDARMGDTIIARGKVTDKRLENGEYLVDLEIKAENIRGILYTAAVATVSLCSKTVPRKWD
jgi:acyl dehydratase